MKKLLFFALGLVGICTAASAQTGFGWGVKGGLNITGMTNSEEGQSKTGFVVGAFADYRFTQKFALSVDALYSRQGVSFGKTDDVRSKTRLNYLNVPILANYYIFDGRPSKPVFSRDSCFREKRWQKVTDTRTKRIYRVPCTVPTSPFRSVSRMIARSESSSKPAIISEYRTFCLPRGPHATAYSH